MHLNKMALVSVLCLTGCVDREFFVRQNVTYDKYERDYVECGTQATQQVPTNTQVGWAPYVGIYSVDTNTELRMRNFEICMRDRGYSEVTLPYCQNEALQSAQSEMALPQDRSRRMRIVPGSCYVLKADGSPYLYSPA